MKHSYKEFWEYQGYKIIECLDCGFKHIDPLPDGEHVSGFYKNIYHNQFVKFPYHEVTDERVRQILSQIDNVQAYCDIYQKASEFLPSKQHYRGMDVGCGHNLLLKYLQNRHWEVYGIEPGKEAAEYLKKFGLEIIEETVEFIDSFGLKEISFVNIQYVLEHVVNPAEVIKKLADLLEPGGVIRIVVPNDFSEGQLAYAGYHKSPIKWVNLPDHISYFSFDSLSRLLSKVGLREVYRTTNFPLEFLLLGGINYYADEAEQKKVGPFVHNFETALKQSGRSGLLNRLYENFARLGMGRAVILYAIKDR
jgi:SAM-dependent methyltransferase